MTSPTTTQPGDNMRALVADDHLKALEMQVVGTCIEIPNSFAIACTVLKPEDFCTIKPRIAFEALVNLYNDGIAIDLLLVYEDIKRRGLESKISLTDLLDMTTMTVSAANIERHARIVKQESIRRDLFKMTVGVARKCNAMEDVFDIFADIEKDIEKVFKGITNQRHRTILEVARSIEKKAESPDAHGFTMLPSEELNKLGRVERGDVVTIAGRPGMGKSTFSISAIVHMGLTQKLSVTIISIEMPAEDILIRLICNITQLRYADVKYQKLSEEDAKKYREAVDLINQSRINIIDTQGLTMADIRIIAFQMKRTIGLDCLIIDYGGLIEHMGNDQHRIEIGRTSRLMKKTAMELQIGILDLWQLSREVEKRPDKRPQLSDLKESGDIEADSDRVIFLWRPEYYNIKEVELGPNKEQLKTENAIVLLQDKYRNGKTGYAVAKFYGEHFDIRGATVKEKAADLFDDIPF